MVLKSLVLILSSQRHSTTTLCEYIENIDKTINCSKSEILCHWSINYRSPLHKLDNIINKLESNISIYCLKIMPHDVHTDSVGLKYIEEIIKKYEKIIKIIILRRDLKDSYNSLCKSLTTGNWGTTPIIQKYNEENNITEYINANEIIPYEEYLVKNKLWFKNIEDLISKYELNVLNLEFKQVITNNLNIVKKFLLF